MIPGKTKGFENICGEFGIGNKGEIKPETLLLVEAGTLCEALARHSVPTADHTE